MTEFISQAVLKRDLFSETHKGHPANAPEIAAARPRGAPAPPGPDERALRLLADALRPCERSGGAA